MFPTRQLLMLPYSRYGGKHIEASVPVSRMIMFSAGCPSSQFPSHIHSVSTSHCAFAWQLSMIRAHHHKCLESPDAVLEVKHDRIDKTTFEAMFKPFLFKRDKSMYHVFVSYRCVSICSAINANSAFETCCTMTASTNVLKMQFF